MTGDARSPVVRTDDGPLAILTMDAPPLNLFDRRMIAGWRDAVAELEGNPPRGLLIRAEGRVVSGGVDVHLFDELDAAKAAELFRELLSITRTIERLSCPTVFAAHALTLTASFEISLGCDFFLAARSATFGLVETVVGVTPAMGGTQRLVERAGPMRARELVMTGDLYDADTLAAWNVVTSVLDDDGFADEALAFALRLAHGPTLAHGVTKNIVRSALEGGTKGADAMVPDAVGALFETADLQNAVASFLRDGPGHATFRGV